MPIFLVIAAAAGVSHYRRRREGEAERCGGDRGGEKDGVDGKDDEINEDTIVDVVNDGEENNAGGDGCDANDDENKSGEAIENNDCEAHESLNAVQTPDDASPYSDCNEENKTALTRCGETEKGVGEESGHDGETEDKGAGAIIISTAQTPSFTQSRPPNNSSSRSSFNNNRRLQQLQNFAIHATNRFRNRCDSENNADNNDSPNSPGKNSQTKNEKTNHDEKSETLIDCDGEADEMNKKNSVSTNELPNGCQQTVSVETNETSDINKYNKSNNPARSYPQQNVNANYGNNNATIEATVTAPISTDTSQPQNPNTPNALTNNPACTRNNISLRSLQDFAKNVRPIDRVISAAAGHHFRRRFDDDEEVDEEPGETAEAEAETDEGETSLVIDAKEGESCGCQDISLEECNAKSSDDGMDDSDKNVSRVGDADGCELPCYHTLEADSAAPSSQETKSEASLEVEQRQGPIHLVISAAVGAANHFKRRREEARNENASIHNTRTGDSGENSIKPVDDDDEERDAGKATDSVESNHDGDEQDYCVSEITNDSSIVYEINNTTTLDSEEGIMDQNPATNARPLDLAVSVGLEAVNNFKRRREMERNSCSDQKSQSLDNDSNATPESCQQKDSSEANEIVVLEVCSDDNHAFNSHGNSIPDATCSELKRFSSTRIGEQRLRLEEFFEELNAKGFDSQIHPADPTIQKHYHLKRREAESSTDSSIAQDNPTGTYVYHEVPTKDIVDDGALSQFWKRTRRRRRILLEA